MPDQPAPSDADRALSAASLRDRAAELAAQRIERPMAGRGIVIVAGGARIFVNAYVLLFVLRNTLQCRLPIELWHFGRGEISASMAAALDGLDVVLVDATAMNETAASGIRDGWQLKPFALFWSGFAEALLLDADQVPVTDPAGLFDWPAYRATGAIFWPDAVALSADNPVWAALGLAPETTTSFESGQVLLDKRRCLIALAATVALNEQAERIHKMIYGDKDTFLLGWRLTGAPFTLLPHAPFGDDRGFIQRDFDGAPLFQHRSSCKWTYSGEQYRLPGFVHEEACLAAIAALREKWNGRVFAPPARGPAARAAEARLIAAATLRMEVVDEENVRIEMRPHGEFGAGRAYDRQNWFVGDSADSADGDGRLSLVFRDGERTTYEFAETAPGVWTGRRFRFPEVEISLVATGAAIAEPPATAAGLVDALLRSSGFPLRPEGDDALAGALALIARVESGVAERLQALAGAEPDEPRAARLRWLADRIAGDVWGPQPPRSDPGIIERGYVRARKPAL